ncbi:hypothetical protein FB45DRAFT_69933 [Roridomyces roridus]|uniref:F-box domain-containing protein n=1 Tax=Roridomyces roridus TaxID=1738132 RepID=A0AAD7BN30_9AGAR|nr:hypothetical protein FB45DRAFT_69933 [Roridomyces roridus]
MSSRCSECGGTIFPKDKPEHVVPSTTPGILARYHRLAKCNEPPESAEKSFIQAVASQTAARLTRLDDEISRLKHRLGQLEAEQAELSDYQRQNATILSPLRRMPPEVLTEVFLWTDCYASDVKCCRAWVLSQVSSRWRAITLSLPSLWSFIFVSFRAKCPSLDMIQTQMDRSRCLKIHFFGSEAADSAPQIKLFNLLSQQSNRWEELNIQLTKDLVPHLNAIRGRLASLRRLWVQCSDASSDMGTNLIDCFDTAPLLAEAGWFNASHFIPLAVLLPVHQLTCYRANGPWETHHRNFLKIASHLVEAWIAIQFDDADWRQNPATGGIVDLPHLRRLFVSDIEILAHLRAPSLVELAIRMRSGGPPALDYLGPFFDRSSCAPHTLCLSGTLDASVTAAILQEYAFIKRFRLVVNKLSVDENTIRNAVNAHTTLLIPGATSVSPHLDEISFGSYLQGAPIDYSLFLKMLLSRRGTLKAAAFFTEHGPISGAEIVTASDELRRSGLRVSMRSGREARKRYRGLDVSLHMELIQATPSLTIVDPFRFACAISRRKEVYEFTGTLRDNLVTWKKFSIPCVFL